MTIHPHRVPRNVTLFIASLRVVVLSPYWATRTPASTAVSTGDGQHRLFRSDGPRMDSVPTAGADSPDKLSGISVHEAAARVVTGRDLSADLR
ncbi:exported hypothetical protein [Curtobacterium sp. 8I-2]|nr:exported hypothetical protein [Curtobacterium sp. 8I-2]